MAIMAKDTTKEFIPAPEGLHQAVCVDIEDRGLQDYGYGEKETVVIKWQINERHPELDKPFLVTCLYTNSLHKKAKLRQHLEAWVGRKFKPEELEGFDLERLLGANCQLQVIHRPSENGTFANVQSIVPLGKGMKGMKAEDFTRFKDRDNDNAPQKLKPEPSDDDDLPF